MPLVNKSYIPEFNNSFSSQSVDNKPVFNGGYLFGATGAFHKKERENKDQADYYLEVKCSSDLSPTGINILKESEIENAIEDPSSFSFFIKNYSAENKSSIIRGDLVVFDYENEGGSFDNLLVRNSKNEYFLKTSNGEIGGTKYIEADTFREKTFFVKLSENQGQKIFGMDVQYSDGILTSMTPTFVSSVEPELNLQRDEFGEWNETETYSLFVPIAIVDMDTKSTTNLVDDDIGISDGGGGSLGINGKSGPSFNA